MNNLKEIYTNKIIHFQKELNYQMKLSRLFSYIRAISFIAALVLIYYIHSIEIIVFITALSISLSSFIWFIIKTLHIKFKITKTEILIKINEDEIQALKNEFEIFHAGSEYIDHDHPYSYDLDIFGTGSVFQYLNRTCTISGKNQLAHDLSAYTENYNNIIPKQEAVKELSLEIDFRQDFISTALSYDKEFQLNQHLLHDDTLEKLNFWAGNNVKFINKKHWRFLLYMFPILTFLILFAHIIGLFPFSFFVLSGLLNLTIIGFYIRKINSEHSKLGKITKSLKKTQELLLLTEQKHFKSEYLIKITNKLNEGISALKRIKKLNKTLQAFDSRLNILVGVLLNATLLWDLQILSRLEKQKKDLKNNLPIWFDLIGEIDALQSLANFSYNNPQYVYPTISEHSFYLSLEEIGHPLIKRDQRISNDFSIIDLKKITIITGANMAGKSTFLRTIGVNMVLAMTGSPVCANTFEFSPIQIYTSVRTNDSLHKNESYFFAELMRLKKITDSLKSGNKLFIIMDEMLKGTNSKDKHTGSYALIEQLIKYNASGLAATHDVELGKLADIYPNNISNKRFEVEIINDELVFDYKLKEGISQNLNASFLMKKYGIIE